MAPQEADDGARVFDFRSFLSIGARSLANSLDRDRRSHCDGRGKRQGAPSGGTRPSPLPLNGTHAPSTERPDFRLPHRAPGTWRASDRLSRSPFRRRAIARPFHASVPDLAEFSGGGSASPPHAPDGADPEAAGAAEEAGSVFPGCVPRESPLRPSPAPSFRLNPFTSRKRA